MTTLAAINWPTVMSILGGMFILAVGYYGWTRQKAKKG